METLAVKVATEESFARSGDHLVITAGLPLQTMGPTNVMRLVQVQDGQPELRREDPFLQL